MSEPSQTCPSGWNQITVPHRACTGIPFNCASANIASGGQAYREVCGEISGIGIGLPDAFYRHNGRNSRRIERNYLDGVSITYGNAGSHQHIWSLAMGHTHHCPCDLPNSSFEAPSPPTEVGNNFYCTSVADFTESPLWQGNDCSANDPCCSYNDPPLFKTKLPSVTTEDMELRICMVSSPMMRRCICSQWKFTFNDNVQYAYDIGLVHIIVITMVTLIRSFLSVYILFSGVPKHDISSHFLYISGRE